MAISFAAFSGNVDALTGIAFQSLFVNLSIWRRAFVPQYPYLPGVLVSTLHNLKRTALLDSVMCGNFIDLH